MNAIGHDLDELVEPRRRNAVLAWAFAGAVGLLALRELLLGDLRGAAFAGLVFALVVAPGPLYRTWAVTLPWEVAAGAAAAVLAAALLEGPVVRYVSIATLAVVAVVDLHLFTRARMSHRVAAGLVAVFTAAFAGAWVTIRWLAATGLGRPVLPDQAALMIELAAAAVVGVVAGIVFEAYVLGWEARLDRFTPLLEGDP